MASPTTSGSFHKYCDAFHNCAREISNVKNRREKITKLIDRVDKRAMPDEFFTDVTKSIAKADKESLKALKNDIFVIRKSLETKSFASKTARVFEAIGLKEKPNFEINNKSLVTHLNKLEDRVDKAINQGQKANFNKRVEACNAIITILLSSPRKEEFKEPI